MADIDLDALAAKFAAAVKRTPTPPEDGDDGDDGRAGGRVPRHRLNAYAADNKALRAQIAEMSADLQVLTDGYAAKVADLEQRQEKAFKDFKEEHAGKVASLAQANVEDLALGDLGIKDPLGRKAARDAFAALPDADKPASVVEWLTGAKDAFKARQDYFADPKADPEQAPAAPLLPTTVAPYFADMAKTPTAKPPGVKPPGVDKAVHTGPPPSALDMTPGEGTGFAEFVGALKQGSQPAG